MLCAIIARNDHLNHAATVAFLTVSDVATSAPLADGEVAVFGKDGETTVCNEGGQG